MNRYKFCAGLFSELPNRRYGRDYLRSDEKRTLDRIGQTVLWPIAGPMVTAAGVAVRAYDGGPAFVGLPRVGYQRQEFTQYKIRSMVTGSATALPSDRRKSADDLRITPVGRWLRHFSVDELPQLYNVNQGTMSLIGPRPKALGEYQTLCAQDPAYAEAYESAAPGMTGLEQIRGRADATDEVRIAAAVEYAETACVALDADILAKTLGVLLTRRSAY